MATSYSRSVFSQYLVARGEALAKGLERAERIAEADPPPCEEA